MAAFSVVAARLVAQRNPGPDGSDAELSGHSLPVFRRSLLSSSQGRSQNLRILPGTKTNPLGNQHLYADKGHSGNYRNQTTGQLIDRQAMMNRNNQIADGCP